MLLQSNLASIQAIFFTPFCFISNAGITNYEEYSLIQETVEEKKEDGMGTLRKERTLLRDDKKMEKLKAKLHTDDEREFSFGRFTLSSSCFSCTRGSRGVAGANPSGLRSKAGSHSGQVTSLSQGLFERQTTVSEPFTCWKRCGLVRLSFSAHK